MNDHSVQDIFRMRILTEVTLSPDNNYLAYLASSFHKEFEKLNESKVVLQELKTGEEKEISDEGTANTSINFSPDSSRVSWISSGKEENFLTIRDITSDSVEQLRVKGKLISSKWRDNASMVLLVEDHDEDFEKKKKVGDDGYYFEENHKFHSLWSYAPGRGMTRITSGIQIWEFSLKNGNAIAVTSDFPYDWSWYEPRISLIDLTSGKHKTVYTPEKRQISHPRISHDGKHAYFIECLMSDNGVDSGDILRTGINGSEIKNLTEDMEKSFSSFDEAEDGTIFALANNMGTFEIIKIHDGKVIWSSFGAVSPGFSPKFSRSGDSFALAYSSKDNPFEVLSISKDGKSKVVTARNKELDDLKRYNSKLVTWKSTDGLEIYGLFRSAGKGAPLIVSVHGGPTSASTENFINYSTVFLGAGFSVFEPNYRGSTGKGRKYAELNRGDLGGMDFEDIMSGVDHIVKTEDVDGKRLYITGGSYGGFLSAWAITQTDRFKASVSLFGISDWISFHGVSSLATWDSIHYDEDPYKFDRFLKFSAIRYLDNVKTPMLMMHGIEDPYVPVGQYRQLYRALKDKRKEASLLLFPREGHGFRERKHVQMYISEAVKYFNRFK